MSTTSLHHLIRNSLRVMALAILLQAVPAAAKEPLIARFQLQDSSGQRIDSSQFAGKTVLVSFFTSGCNLCARDFRLMREFYVGNAKRNFVQLGISLDQPGSESSGFRYVSTAG
ncbi:redoxin domain-containing protein [Undibacterium sp. CY7W]|uniref:Redoxin domain-containing protein n=1 Tax=Undibacterium rugosum TaxID=2762291 RepID=A0A923HZ50_9BURK|nr:redoxin domain-containing protein [Undibacterium rugosum]MBC3933992.1 redoxin domain-containing protein [Undibacterium rugosum]